MDNKLIDELKKILEKQKIVTEQQLKSFAKKDDKVKGDWDTRFPKFDGGESGSAALEKAADEVEAYSTLLPLEHNLETSLKDINLALEKIRNTAKGEPRQGQGKYGICEKCGKEIPEERLKVHPEARFCIKCENK